MDLSGRRRSTNVEDRRSGATGKVLAGTGIIGTVLALFFTILSGGKADEVLPQLIQQSTVTEAQRQNYEPTEQELQFEDFALKVLASTEDVWTEVFKKMGRTYEKPTLVLFKGSVQSGCGNASASVGPFYCSADKKIYIDLDFFNEMKTKLGADGDFAQAYVIAHEVGHHVQNLLGVLGPAHSKMAQASEAEKNKISVRIELQADFYSGIWGYYENKMFGSIEPGDFEEAVNAAHQIGDDYLQKNARGYSVPESFTHGTSAQRMRWLKKGLTTGDMSQNDTFGPAYNSL